MLSALKIKETAEVLHQLAEEMLDIASEHPSQREGPNQGKKAIIDSGIYRGLAYKLLREAKERE